MSKHYDEAQRFLDLFTPEQKTGSPLLSAFGAWRPIMRAYVMLHTKVAPIKVRLYFLWKGKLPEEYLEGICHEQE